MVYSISLCAAPPRTVHSASPMYAIVGWLSSDAYHTEAVKEEKNTMARKGNLCKTITLPDGSRKWVYAKTEDELNRKVIDIQMQIGLGIDLTNNDTFGEFALMWYRTYKSNLREATKRNIKSLLNTHIMPQLSGYKMRDITPMHIQRLFNILPEELSVGTRTKLRSILSDIFRTAVENNVIIKSPITKSLRIGGRETKPRCALTKQQEKKLLADLFERIGAANTKLRAEAAHWLWLFCLLGLQTGLRRGELLGLMWSDVNFDNATLSVNRAVGADDAGRAVISSDLKTDAAHRTVPLPPKALAALTEARAKSTSLFILAGRDGQPLSDAVLSCRLKKLENIDLGGIHVTPHILRHTYCTRLFDSGLDVKEAQRMMGHANPAVTLEVYTHYNEEDRFTDTAKKIRAAL